MEGGDWRCGQTVGQISCRLAANIQLSILWNKVLMYLCSCSCCGTSIKHEATTRTSNTEYVRYSDVTQPAARVHVVNPSSYIVPSRARSPHVSSLILLHNSFMVTTHLLVQVHGTYWFLYRAPAGSCTRNLLVPVHGTCWFL